MALTDSRVTADHLRVLLPPIVVVIQHKASGLLKIAKLMNKMETMLKTSISMNKRKQRTKA